MTESLLELELTGLELTGDTGGAAISDSGAEVDLGCKTQKRALIERW